MLQKPRALTVNSIEANAKTFADFATLPDIASVRFWIAECFSCSQVRLLFATGPQQPVKCIF